MMDTIKLSHGDGGIHTNELIKSVFLKNYGDEDNDGVSDSFVFSIDSSKLAYTTDSFVVRPLFFKGGDIGKLSICGTINDLVTAGAIPLYISVGFIVEEEFEIESLCTIAKSMSDVCKKTGVKIVTGDTKVVEKGSADGVFINTSGIGIVSELYRPCNIESGDEIIITGTIAQHGTAILIDRYDLAVQTDITSDCSPLNDLILGLGEELKNIKLMKDPTRGGIATVLNEIVQSVDYNIELFENKIPIDNQVKTVNEILGVDPLYLACEGRMVLVTKKGSGNKVLSRIKNLTNCKDAKIIGHFALEKNAMVYMNTQIGGKRIIPTLEGQTIPRIC